MNVSETEFPFSFMYENYLLLKGVCEKDFVSQHWAVFGDNFKELLNRQEIWPRMLRNALTIGLNDNLIKISNQRFYDESYDYWENLRKGSYEDLIFDPEENDAETQKLLSFFHDTARLTSYDYLIDNCMQNICSPVGLELNVTHKDTIKTIFCNQHDLDDVYHSYLILSEFHRPLDERPLICEIGSGYGGLISKIKKNVINGRCILFDLPEVNIIQSYFLSNVFPDAKFLGYKDYLEKGTSLINSDFDFLILPGWVAKDILEKYSVDLFINIRSFMEMPPKVIADYFNVIHNSIKMEGLFACFNRYSKPIGSKEERVVNEFKNYPFDNKWIPKLSRSSDIQPHIHLLLAERNSEDIGINFDDHLKNAIGNSF